MNNLTAFAKKFEFSQSDASTENPYGWETWINMLGMIVGQLYEQRTIAQIPRMLGFDKRTVDMTKNITA